MKKILLINAIGNNGVFRKGGCPLVYNDPDYNGYFRNLSRDYPMILSEEIYDELLDKVNPYPCHKVYVIDPNGTIAVPSKSMSVTTVASLEDALKRCENSEKIIINPGDRLRHDLIAQYESDIDLFVLVRFNEDFSGDEKLEQRHTVNFFPTIKSTAKKFTITEYGFNPLF